MDGLVSYPLCLTYSRRNSLNERIQHPTIKWLSDIATRIRSDFSRFYRDTDKDRVRFNFGETPTTYTFKVKFTPSHRTLKFIVPKDSYIPTIECQLYEKTNNIVRDIDQIYTLVAQEYLIPNIQAIEIDAVFFKLWHWGCIVRNNSRHDIYKVQAQWFEQQAFETMSPMMLYTALITKVETLSHQKQTIMVGDGLQTIGQPIVQLQLELTTPEKIFNCIVNVEAGLVRTIYPGQLYITNWIERYAIMRFNPAKHHLSFTPEQYAFITDYVSEENKNGYKSSRKES